METGAERGKGLRDAVEHLYEVFARYRWRTLIDPFFEEPGIYRIKRRLQRVHVRRMSALDLRLYEGLVSPAAPDSYLLARKHVFPRLAEMIAFEDGDSIALSDLGLEFLDCQGWPPEERDAVEGYLLALWRETLTRSDDWRTARMLEYLAPIVSDLKPYLEAWTTDRSQSALGALTQFAMGWDWNRRTEERPWTFNAAQRKLIEVWLLSQALPVLERGFHALSSGPLADQVALAIDHLSCMT